MAKIHVRRSPFMFPGMVVIGFILWIYANSQISLLTQSWIAKLVTRCLRINPRIAMPVSGNLETTEVKML